MKIFLSILFLLPAFVFAQGGSLQAYGSGSNMYLLHSAGPKENFYSIGRLYNISPKEIAPFNDLSMEKGLSIGQQIKIPLMAGNFSKSPSVAGDEAAVPVYISGAAKKQVVGYLRVKKDVSALAVKGAGVPTMVVPPSKPVISDETVTTIVEPAKVPAPATQNPPPVVRSENPRSEPVRKGEKNFKGGAFKVAYQNGSQAESGRAGIFKSTSGWEDGKYYCLHNSAPQNSIVKITNTATNKTIYAKVLDVIPDLKQNIGLAIQLSNAAADELGASGEFAAMINY